MLDDNKIAELKQREGAVYLFEKGGYRVLLRKPPSLAYKRWINERESRKDDPFGVNETFARACILYPESPVDVSSMFDDWPGGVMEIAGECAAIAHKSEKADAKKL